MRSPAPIPRAVPSGQSSFTLVEILVALAILSFILVIMSRMLGLTSSAYSEGRSRIDDFTKGRAMMDLIAGDIQKGIFRPDLAAFGLGSQFATNNGALFLLNNGATNAFFTRRAGVGANVRDLSLVSYTLVLTNAVLERSDYAVPWTPAGDWASSLPFGTNLDAVLPNASAREAANGVIALELAFQRQDGSLTNAYSGYIATNPVVAVGIGLAVIDRQTLKLLSPQNLADINAMLVGSFTQSVLQTNGIKAGWDAALTGAFFSAYPKPLATGLKTFERWVPCQPPF